MAEHQGLKGALDTTKQFIVLATGILTITITFADKFRIEGTSLSVPGTLKTAWVGYLLVIVFAAWTLMAVTGTLDEVAKGKEGSALDSNIRLPAFLMVVAFLLAVGCTIAAGFQVVR